jgi:hypothetical protein
MSSTASTKNTASRCAPEGIELGRGSREHAVEPHRDRGGEGGEAGPDHEADLALERLGGDPRGARPRERDRADQPAAGLAIAQQQQRDDRSEDAPRERAVGDLLERAVVDEAKIVLGPPQRTEPPRPATVGHDGDAEHLARRRDAPRDEDRLLDGVELIREQRDQTDRDERRDERDPAAGVLVRP